MAPAPTIAILMAKLLDDASRVLVGEADEALFSHGGAPWLQQQQCRERRHEIHRARGDENRLPSTGGETEEAGKRDQQRGSTFCCIEHAGVGRGILHPEGIGADRRKQAVYLSPSNE